MDQEETIRRLLDTIDQQRQEIDQLRHENELLRGRIKELEARLAQYENAHTPPSLKRGGHRKKNLKDESKGKPGQKIGHIGLTRPTAKPDRQVQVTKDICPDCGAKLGNPFRIEPKIIEDIPEPQPSIATEYQICHYICPCCHKEVVATDPGCPSEGIFGKNTIAQVALLKYKDRLTHRKIKDALKRTYGLAMSPATILDLTRRAADAVQSDYDTILSRIRNSPVLYVDETSLKVQGKNHWIWVFTTPSDAFFVVRNSRGMKVLLEVLTSEFKGTIVCDGWKSYPGFTNRLQRCWAHLLRESKDLAEKIPEAAPLHETLKDLYDQIIDALKSDPPPNVRKVALYLARARLNRLIAGEYADPKVKNFIGKVSNGLEFWFTFVIQKDVEPTNNRAERALREHVVQRKIIGTLRNSKGTSIHERLMTVLATWPLQGLDCLKMLRLKLSG